MKNILDPIMLLTLPETCGFKVVPEVDYDNNEPQITATQIQMLAEREGFQEVRYLNSPCFLLLEYNSSRVNIHLDSMNQIEFTTIG